jgi:hypothetical protein
MSDGRLRAEEAFAIRSIEQHQVALLLLPYISAPSKSACASRSIEQHHVSLLLQPIYISAPSESAREIIRDGASPQCSLHQQHGESARHTLRSAGCDLHLMCT